MVTLTLRRYVILCLLLHIQLSLCCINDVTYTHDDPEQTCSWIRWKEERRQSLCQIEIVRTKCPQTCGLCCEDDASYTFLNRSSKMKDCAWIIASSQERKDLYCSLHKNGRMVRDGCPSACNVCQAEVKLPEGPSGAATQEEPDIEPKRGLEKQLMIIALVSCVALVSLIALYKCHEENDIFESMNKSKTDKVASDITTVDLEKGNRDDNTEHGVSAFWLKHYLLKKVEQSSQDINTVTIHDIENSGLHKKGMLCTMSQHHICSRDGQIGSSIVDCLQGDDNVGPSNMILSYSGSNSLRVIVDTIWDHCTYNKLDPKRTYIWAYFLCNNYHRSVEDRTRGSTIRESYVALCERISSIGNVLAIVSPWDEPTFFTNAWGLFELFNVMELGRNLVITMSKKEKKRLVMESLQNEDDLLDLFNRIDKVNIESSKSSDPADKENILEFLKEHPGIERFNNDVNRLLRMWATAEIKRSLKYHENRSKDALTDEELAFTYSQVGYVLNRVGQFADAISLYKQALSIYCNVRGDRQDQILDLQAKIGIARQAEGNMTHCDVKNNTTIVVVENPHSKIDESKTVEPVIRSNKTTNMNMMTKKRRKTRPTRFGRY
jgi:hypothetical protein